MKIDFIPLANVPTVESLTDSAKVLVIDSGEVKKTAKSNIGGGGGGSSDFSTAEVTINVAEGLTVFISLPFTTSTESIDFLSPYWISGYSDNSVDVVLYKGKASGRVLSGSDEVEVAVTGDISVEDGAFFITGSGTITFTSPVT